MLNRKFEVVAPFKPTGDQPQAIENLADGLENEFTAQIFCRNFFCV